MLTTIAAVELHGVYAHYAAIVDGQIDQQLLQRRVGIYAAPRRVSVEQQISQDELKERLLRAGYRQRERSDGSSSGSFVFEGDTVELRTNEIARASSLPETLKIKFSKGSKSNERIINIENGVTGQGLKSAALPPELITTDGNTMLHPRSFARFDEFPPSLVNALIAIEDRHFFLHRGVDLKAICRAMWANWRHGEIREGGSTITQQLIKTNFLTPERTYERKFAEAMMAVAIERRLSKEEIFTIYANRVYLGQSGLTAVYGFKQAARVFFDKDLPELSLAESALIAGLVQAPSRYSPYLHPDAAIARRNTVLDAMVEIDEISVEEAEASKAEKLTVVPSAEPDEEAAQHFVDYLRRELASRNISEKEERSLRIQTTLDLDLQQAANIAVKNHMAKIDRVFGRRAKGTQAGSNLPEAALIAIDPHTGEILAMVGGRDYAASQLNRVTDARRQPGSVFKPIVYAAALTHGISPGTTFDDAPRDFVFGHEIYRPENYGGRFSNRTVTLREGIVRSLNVVAVDAAMRVGLPRVANIAQRMGLPRPEAYPSMALGAFEATPFEIAQAYSAFANSGKRVAPFGIKTIIEGDVAARKNTAMKTIVFNTSTAYLITETLADVVNHGTATRIRGMGYRGPAAGKTGSSRDAWFAGYTPKMLVVVWVGFDNHRDLGMTGGDAAVPIWTDFVKRALALRPDLNAEKFTEPTGLELVEIDPTTGMLAHEDCPSRKSVMINILMAPPYCSKHQSSQVRVSSRKSDSVLAGNTRRSVRKARPATDSAPAGNPTLHPVTEEDDLPPDLPPAVIRRPVDPLTKRLEETRPPVILPVPRSPMEQKTESKKVETPRPNH
ncbi:MAG: transglycosylase domain-containing protein [Blastocatellales bacterium]